MKKEYILIILVVSLGVIYYFFGNKYSPIKNYPPKNTTIVAFGDSLIEGYGSSSGNDFISILSRKIKRPIINLGVPGNTTEDGLNRINEVMIKNPGTVIVLFGGNDYLRDISKDETFNNLRQIISTLESNGVFVILLGVQGGVLSDNYKSSFDSLANQMGVVYVPNVLSGVFGDSRYMSDIVHPNDAGYDKIAERVYDTINRYIW